MFWYTEEDNTWRHEESWSTDEPNNERPQRKQARLATHSANERSLELTPYKIFRNTMQYWMHPISWRTLI